jgi:hypothetical protein
VTQRDIAPARLVVIGRSQSPHACALGLQDHDEVLSSWELLIHAKLMPAMAAGEPSSCLAGAPVDAK